MAGRLSSKLTPKGDTIHYDYDKLNGLAEKTYENEKGEEADRPVRFVYNAMGQRMSMEDITGESSYTYDSLERLKTATNGSGKVVEYYYDEANNLSGILYPDGYDVQYEYDLNDNITKIIDRDRRDTVYEYDPLNRITKTIRADGTYSEFVYNARNQILKVENFCGCGFSISSYKYTYDDAGQIVAETAVECLDTTNKDYSHVGGSNDKCAHKQTNPWMNQNPSRQTTKRTFEYDDNGELIGCIEDKRQSDGQFWKYAYTYEYDEVGNRTMAKKRNCNVGGSPDVRYHYDTENRLKAVYNESYYSGKAVADRFIATLGKSLDKILWYTILDLPLLLKMIGQSGSGPLAGALSGGGSISAGSGAIAVTIGESVIIAVVGAVTVAGGSQILQSEGNKNASKNQEKADKAAAEESGTWKKIYKDGYDAYGNEVSIHYFQSESGMVFDVKVKPGWSN